MPGKQKKQHLPEMSCIGKGGLESDRILNYLLKLFNYQADAEMAPCVMLKKV